MYTKRVGFINVTYTQDQNISGAVLLSKVGEKGPTQPHHFLSQYPNPIFI